MSTGASVAVQPGKPTSGRFGITSASASADCQAAGGACPTTTRSTSTGTDDRAVLAATQTSGKAGARARTTTAVATATCAGNGPCQSSTNGYASDNVAEVAAGCAGTGCRTAIQGEARYDGNSATTRSACTAGADGVCGLTGRVAAAQTDAQASAACDSADGTCTLSYKASSKAGSTTAGNRATAQATCGASGGAGTGWCATNGVAQTGTNFAVAGAACDGSAGSGCRYSYRAHSAASTGSAAHGSATGSGRGTVGGGQVMTTAAAAAGPGFAQAAASCVGTAGSNCRYSYSRGDVSASAGGGAARASASGSGGGRQGGGGVAVTAQAAAGPGFANASASCVGAANCRYSYSARISAAASYGAAHASASASGSGGGRQGGGGVAVTAQAAAGPGFANASASCMGAANCSHSYSANVSAEGRLGVRRRYGAGRRRSGLRAGPRPATGRRTAAPDTTSARRTRRRGWGEGGNGTVHGSGRGGQGAIGGAVSVKATAGPNNASISMSCSAQQCSGSGTAHAEDHAKKTTKKGTATSDPTATCRISGGNGACGATAIAVANPDAPGKGTVASCWGGGTCEAARNVKFVPAQPKPSAKAKGKDGTSAPGKGKGKNEYGVIGRTDKDGNVILEVRNADGTKPKPKVCESPCKKGLALRGEDGQSITYDPGAKKSQDRFQGRNPQVARKPSASDDRCNGSKGCSLSADKDGNRGGSVDGKGGLYDGYSDTTVTYTQSNPVAGNQHNEATFANKNGARFQTTYHGRRRVEGPEPEAPRQVRHVHEHRLDRHDHRAQRHGRPRGHHLHGRG